MDYSKVIDQETWAFINRTGDYYPPETATFPVSKQREIYDLMCREFFQGYPDGVTGETRQVDGVNCRFYATEATTDVTIMYFHGGGFVVGGLDSHDDVCAEICARTGHRVISVDYRMAPEHHHPAAYDDCQTVTNWALAHYAGPVVLVGDSAGGNLAAAVAHASRGGTNRIIGQVLIYPVLGGKMDRGSYLEHAEAPMLTLQDILFYKGIRCKDGVEPVNDPTYAPLHDLDFSALPPSVIVSAGCDPLSDDGRDYRDALLAAGVPAVWFNEEGLVHGYLRARTTVQRAARSFDRIIDAISALARREWPY